MKTVQQQLDEAGVTFFAAWELYSRKAKGAPRDVEPPENLRPNIIPTAVLANEIRRRFGKPLRASAYRDKNYNRIVGGGRDSEHLGFRAIDLFPIRGDVEQLVRIGQAVMEEAHRSGMRTGFGIYPWGIHIDTGALPPKRKRRRWIGSK